MQCNNCGNQNNEESKFCKYCGQCLESQVIEKKKGNKKIILLMIAIALITLIVGGYFAIKSRISRNSNQASNGYEETLDRGNKYLESMDYEKAELEYLDAINIEPKEEEAYVELAELYVVWGKPEEAKKIVAEGISNVPEEKQQKLPEKKEETAEYQSYTWVTEPTIEADDIYYVRSLLGSYNTSNLQMESAYAVLKRGDALGLTDFNGELKAPMDYEGISGGETYFLYRKESTYEEEFEMEWRSYGLVNDEIRPISRYDDAPTTYYYYENELQSLLELNEGFELDMPIPVQKTDTLLTLNDGELSGLYGIYSQGELSVDFIYEECGSYSQGLLAAKKDGKWGYVDDEGNEVIPFEYDVSWKQYDENEEQDYCYAASGGYVVLCKEGAWELRNTQGKVVLPSGYFEEMRPVYEDKCWVKKDGKWGVIQIGDAEEQGEKDNKESNEESDKEVLEQYSEIINKYKTAISEQWDGIRLESEGLGTMFGNYIRAADDYPGGGYAFIDIDQNGVKELVVGSLDSDKSPGTIYDIFTIVDGQITRILTSVPRDYYRLCKENYIAGIGQGGSLSVYTFYTLEEGGLVLSECVICDAYDNHWYYSTTEDYLDDYNNTPISETEAAQIIDSYKYLNISYKSFTE